jgi:hypothetical protein
MVPPPFLPPDTITCAAPPLPLQLHRSAPYRSCPFHKVVAAAIPCVAAAQSATARKSLLPFLSLTVLSSHSLSCCKEEKKNRDEIEEKATGQKKRKKKNKGVGKNERMNTAGDKE